MWLPAIIRGGLEGIYFLTERGRGIERYYTYLSSISFAYIILSLIIARFFEREPAISNY